MSIALPCLHLLLSIAASNQFRIVTFKHPSELCNEGEIHIANISIVEVSAQMRPATDGTQ